ncbi:MAG: lipopolysaccharide kinase InaA family protein [Candidatus Pacebacteria bacterium]|nr:lipopolysaccharide kinase InaA family protein [Candidatus Paceibacterota bacterium]
MEKGFEFSRTEDEKAHMPEKDLHLNYSLLELKGIIARGDDELEKNFETREADATSVAIARAHYESMINNPEAFIGIGNSGIVFKQHPDQEDSTRCVKCRWDFLLVNNRSKKISSLPENIQQLKKVENHFKKVNEKVKAQRGKNDEITPDNGVLREAVLQRAAHQALAVAGKADAIPDIDYIVKIEHEETGSVDGDLFSVSEAVQLMFMEQVDGSNLEEVIYQGSAEIAREIDIDAFEKELREIIAVLHAEGITHNDLTVRNIMLETGTMKPKVIDFGKAAYSKALSHHAMEDDLNSVEQAVKMMRKYKENPKEMAVELKSRQGLTKISI